jgi:excisionase family DNA binding protein
MTTDDYLRIEVMTVETNEAGELLTDVPGLAGLLHVSESTVWRGVRSGVIPVVRVGQRVLIPVNYAKGLAATASKWEEPA